MGVATYKSGNAIRYVGSFVNGIYNGKGTMFFKDGIFLTGEWKNGKLNGKGSFLSESGVLYIGDFINGVKEGKGILFFQIAIVGGVSEQVILAYGPRQNMVGCSLRN